ncbi:MAG: hypothetical protein WCI27_06320 [Candidatus Omnitrophota bacterium]
MQVEVFAICDAATSENGKLNILGAFDTIWVRQFPAVYPHCAVAVKMRFDAIENGAHAVVTRIIDQDGKNVLPPATGSFNVNMPENQRSASTDIVLNIQGLNLAKPGEYALELAVDSRSEISLPLYIRQHPPVSGGVS